MFQPTNLPKENSYSESSFEFLEFGNVPKENTHSHSKEPKDLDSNLKDALNRMMNRPKFIEQIELQCSLNTVPTIRTRQEDFPNITREKVTTEGCSRQSTDIKKHIVNNSMKICSMGELVSSKHQSFSSKRCSEPAENLMKTLNSKNKELKISKYLEAEKDDSMSKGVENDRTLSPQPKTKPPKGRLSFRFNIKRNSCSINPNIIKLIRDKAFSRYEGDDTETKKREPLRSKPNHFMSIMQKHVHLHRMSKRDSLISILDKVKDINLNPFQKFLNQFISVVKKLIRKMTRPADPNSLFILIWEAVIICLVFLDLFLLPFTFAFEEDLSNDDEVFETVDNIQFTLYLLNLLINFNTSYLSKDGHLISSRKKIILNYLVGSFWIDTLSSFPYQLSIKEQDTKDINQAFTFIRLLRFLRIIRVFKVFNSNKLLKNIEQHEYFNTLAMGIFNLVKLSFKITCLAHWCACFWYVLGITSSNSWLQKANLEGEGIDERYIASLYFAITTMLTVGYGDIAPLNLRERIFGILLMIIGGGTFGYTMTSIAEIIKSLEREESKKKKRAKAIAVYMQKKGLNKDLQERVKKYLTFVHENEEKSSNEDKDLLSVLSSNLREEISKQINGKFVNQSPIFKEILTKKLKNLLPVYLEERIASPGEMIFSRDDSDHSIFLLCKGKITLHYESFMQPLANLENGSYFGVESFFTGGPRTKQATSIEFSHLIYITRNKFLEILESYPIDKEMFAMIQDKARLYNDYSSLQTRCYVCNKTDHLNLYCPDIHIVVKKEEAIKNYLVEHQRFCQNFKRRNRKAFNARKHLKTQTSELKEIVELADNISPTELNFEKSEDLEKTNAIRRKNEPKGTLHSLEVPPEIILDANGSRKILIKAGNIGEAFDLINLNKRKTVINSHAHGTLFIEELYTEDKFEFDKVKSYEIYFSHNNITKIIQKINQKNKDNQRFATNATHEGQLLIERMVKILMARSTKNQNGSLHLETPVSINKKESGEAASVKINSVSILLGSQINSEHPQN